MNKFLVILFSISFSGSISFLLFILLDKILSLRYNNWQINVLRILLLSFLIPDLFIPYYYFSTNAYSYLIFGDEINKWITYNNNLEIILNGQLYIISCIIFLIWLFGFIFIIFKTTIKCHKSLKLILKNSELINDAPTNNLKKVLKKELQLKKNIPLYYTNSSSITSACIFGIIHPIILIPKTEIEISTKEFELILRHELSHYKRKDYLFNYIMVLFLATHWFNPLIWSFIEKLNDFTEFACDRLVLKFLSKEEFYLYANLLLKLSNNNKLHFYNAIYLISANEKFMQRRLHNIMKPYKKHRIISSLLILSLSILTPITTYAASKQISTSYNTILMQFPETIQVSSTVSEQIDNINVIKDTKFFLLEPRGISAISDTLKPDYSTQSESVFLNAGRTIDVSVMNRYANGDFQIEILLNGHVMVSKKSTDKTNAFLTYKTKQSGNFAIRIRNLSNNTIKINGTIEIN